MSDNYDNYGDQGPDASPVDRGSGEIADLAALRRVPASRGGSYMWTGIALVLLALFFTASGNLPNVVVGAAFFIGGVVNIATAGVIRAFVASQAR